MGSPAEAQFGPAIVGVFISLILYGIELCQSFMYYRSYPEDTLRLKAFVASLICADTIHALFSMILVYDVLVTHFNDPSYLAKSHPLFNAYPAFVAIISTAVQLFFAWRVRVLTANNYIFGGIVLVVLASLGCGLAIAAEASLGKIFAHIEDFRRLVLIWLLIMIGSEILLTALLTKYMRKPQLFLSSSNDLVKRITRLTLQNGLITTLWTFGDILCYFVGSPGTHLIFCYPLAKLYIISMLSTMNTRPTFQERQLAEPRTNILSRAFGKSTATSTPEIQIHSHTKSSV